MHSKRDTYFTRLYQVTYARIAECLTTFNIAHVNTNRWLRGSETSSGSWMVKGRGMSGLVCHNILPFFYLAFIYRTIYSPFY